MKRSFILLLTIFSLPLVATAQGVNFDGDWAGTVTVKDRGSLEMRFVIKDGKFDQYYLEDDTWSPAGRRPMEYYREYGDIAMLGWINSGGVWTENQAYSLTWVDANTVQILWTRHVTNRAAGEPGDSWNIVGEGELKRRN